MSSAWTERQRGPSRIACSFVGLGRVFPVKTGEDGVEDVR